MQATKENILAKTSEVQSEFFKNQTENDNLNSADRMSAAKSALEHHHAAKEHRKNAEDAPTLTQEMQSVAATVVEGVKSTVEAAKPYVQATYETVKTGADYVKHSALGNVETLEAEYYKKKVENTNLPASTRMEAAKSALEHHIVAREHNQEAIQNPVRQKVGEVMGSVAGTINNMQHQTLSKVEQMEADYYKNMTEVNSLSTADRMSAAKSALEHHQAAKEHQKAVTETK